jgi:hypothetical protein
MDSSSIRNHDLIIINGDSFSFGDCQYIQNQYEKGRIIQNVGDLPRKEREFASLFDYTNNWGEHLGQLVNIPILNISQSGSNNDFILRRYMDLFDEVNFDYHINLFPKERYFIQDKKKNIGLPRDYKLYFKPLVITQLSYSHRYTIRLNEKYYAIHPSRFNIDGDIKYKEIIDDRNSYEVIKNHFFLTTDYRSYYDNFIRDMLSIDAYVKSKGFEHKMFIFFTESDILNVISSCGINTHDFLNFINSLKNVYFLFQDALKFEKIKDITNDEIFSYHFSRESHYMVANFVQKIICENPPPEVENNYIHRLKLI